MNQKEREEREKPIYQKAEEKHKQSILSRTVTSVQNLFKVLIVDCADQQYLICVC